MYILASLLLVVPTDISKYHVSVKHITVGILHCCFSVSVHDRPTLPCTFFCVNLYQIWGVISPVGFHESDAANLNVPS